MRFGKENPGRWKLHLAGDDGRAQYSCGHVTEKVYEQEGDCPVHCPVCRGKDSGESAVKGQPVPPPVTLDPFTGLPLPEEPASEQRPEITAETVKQDPPTGEGTPQDDPSETKELPAVQDAAEA